MTIEYGGLPDEIMNLRRGYEPLSRNEPRALETMIRRVGGMAGCQVHSAP